MDTSRQYQSTGMMGGMLAQSQNLATTAVEPDGSPGSLLNEIQTLEIALQSVEKALEEHTGRLNSILLPEMKDDRNVPPTAPEPIRSEYAMRVNSVMRGLRQVGLRIDALSQRAKLT